MTGEPVTILPMQLQVVTRFTDAWGSPSSGSRTLSTIRRNHVRDIHAVTQHIGIAPKQYETSGRMLLGVQPDDRMLLL